MRRVADRRRGRRGRLAKKEHAGEATNSGRVFGLHACRAIIDRRPESIRAAWLLDGAAGGALGELAMLLERRHVAPKRVARSALDQLTDHATHQGIVLDVQSLKPLSLTDFESLVIARGKAVRLLLLDHVEDPRNLGACLRSAAAAGVDAVVVPRDRAAGLSPAAVKAAAGASEFVPLVSVTNLARTLRFLHEAGVRIAGADAAASVSLYEAALEPPIALVLGSEGSGLRRLTREHCDTLFSIPMPGAIESLNVAVSAGIVLFESLRRG
jgi:23S rRNA (guanosine2251-2'-O)-methyltransferase